MLQFYDPNSNQSSGAEDPDKDYGTPAVRAETGNATELVCLTIDGQEVTVPAGTSVMRAAAAG